MPKKTPRQLEDNLKSIRLRVINRIGDWLPRHEQFFAAFQKGAFDAQGRLDAKRCEDIRFQLHKIAGSPVLPGLYDLNDTARNASELLNHLNEGTPLEQVRAPLLQAFEAYLRAARLVTSPQFMATLTHRPAAEEDNKAEIITLLVGAEKAMCATLTPHFQEAGYRVLRAHSADEVITTMHTEQPDAVILDVLITGMTEDIITRQILGTHALRDIPLILRAYEQDKDVSKEQVPIFLKAAATAFQTACPQKKEVEDAIWNILKFYKAA